MANFWQFRSKHPEHKRLYYVCGAEVGLVQEVVDLIISQWSIKPVIFDCDTKGKSFADMESFSLAAHVVDSIIVIQNAQNLNDKRWEHITKWAWGIVHGDIPRLCIIVISDESKPDTKELKFRPFVEQGRYVECKEMTVDSMKKYCTTDYDITEEAADLLLSKVSYNFRKLNNELEKLKCLHMRIRKETIDKFVVFSPSAVILNLLLQRQKDLAIAASVSVNEKDVLTILNTLAKKLAMLYRIMLADGPRMKAHSLAKAVGIKPWQLLEYFEIKRWWNYSSINQAFKSLVKTEIVYRESPKSAMRLLVSWW